VSDIQSDGAKPYETPIEGAEQGYQNLPPTLSEQFGAEQGQSSLAGTISRSIERGQIAGSSWVDQTIVGLGLGAAGQPGSTESPILSPDEYNKQYAPTGPDGSRVSIGDKPMPEAVAKLVGQAKADEITRESILRRAGDANNPIYNFGVATVGFLADPLNLVTTLIPGYGEESVAARLGGGFLARAAGRVASGVSGGVLSQAPLVAGKYVLGQQEASDYDARSAMSDLLMAGAQNAVFHAGLGTALDAYRSRYGGATPAAAAPTPPSPVSPATPAAAAQAISPQATAVITATAPVRRSASTAAISQILDGRPVDVSPLFPSTDTAIGLIPRGDIKPEIQAAPDVESQARLMKPDLFAEHDPLAQRAQELGETLSDPEGKIGAQIDARVAELRQQAEDVRVTQPAEGATAAEVAAQHAADTAQWEALTKQADHIEANRQPAIEAATSAAREEFIPIDLRLRELAPQVNSALEGARAIQGAVASSKMVHMGPGLPDLRDYARRQIESRGYGKSSTLPTQEAVRLDGDIFGPSDKSSTLGETGKVREIPVEAVAEKAEAVRPAETHAGTGLDTNEPSAASTAHEPTAHAISIGSDNPAEERLLAELEASHSHDAAGLTDEERADLESTHNNIQASEARSAGYQEAAMCLISGLPGGVEP
jgi:hypothetical protein